MNPQNVVARLRNFEGVVDYMYRCTGGEVTVGIGHAIQKGEDAVGLAWQIGGRAASPNEIRADFAKVAAAQKGLVATTYAPLTQCRLGQDQINVQAEKDIAGFAAWLEAHLPGWSSFPEPAQEALLDMTFNLGTAGIQKFPKLLDAAGKGDWETAAQECFRNGIGKERNEATAALFRQAKTQATTAH